MPQYNTAANAFAQNTKTEFVAASVVDNLDYIRASVSKMKQADLKNKKFGRQYNLYIPSRPQVRDGLCATPDEIVEIETPITLNNNNVSCALNAWQELTSIESFTKEIAKPFGETLARGVQDRIVKDNIYKNMQAVVAATPSFEVLSDAASALGELAVDGDVVAFLSPTVTGKIAASGLGLFQAAQEAKDIYGKNALGEYAGAKTIKQAALPVLKVGTAATGTLTLVEVEDADNNVIGYEEVTKIAGTNLQVGDIFKLSGLKIVDPSGLKTDQDVVISVIGVNQAGTEGTIMPLRVTPKSGNYNNPNAWVEDNTDVSSPLSLTFGLEANTSYYVGQLRIADALAFDSYKFSTLPGSETEEVAELGPVSLKMSMFGEGNCLEKFIRLDFPHAAGIWDSRLCVGVYIKK